MSLMIWLLKKKILLKVLSYWNLNTYDPSTNMIREMLKVLSYWNLNGYYLFLIFS